MIVVILVVALLVAALAVTSAVLERRNLAVTKAALVQLKESRLAPEPESDTTKAALVQLQEEHAELKAAYAWSEKSRAQQWTDSRDRIARLHRQVFRFPSGPKVRQLDTPIGRFVICKLGGYFGDTAIFVYFPMGFGFSQEIADAVRRETESRFIMDRAPGSSSGGDDAADAIITAGRDYDAFSRGEQGYFKNSPPPDLDEMAAVLTRIIRYPVGVTG